MKFTAEFDSINSAEIAAAAIKHKISNFSELKVTDTAPKPTKEFYTPAVPFFSSFNMSSDNPTYSVPIAYGGIYTIADNSSNEALRRSHPTLEIVCRKEDEKTVSRLIIGYGGRNISKS